MKRERIWRRRETYLLVAGSFLMALLYGGISYAQSPNPAHYVTMSERIGRIIVLYRAFDVWIYFFQALLLFMCIGLSIYYWILFRKPVFVQKIRKKLSELTHTIDMQAAIDFEITSLSNRFLFLDLVIGGAPVAGLLGTVVGLVQVFSEQTLVQHVTMQTIAGGMYVAMVTTVCGLIVALFGIVARHLLDSR
ncbi:MotA/TolQ/ExbB proton channel family protein, partial [candidate division KSB1 bacterium]